MMPDFIHTVEMLDTSLCDDLEFINQVLESCKETYDAFMYPVCFAEGMNIQYYEPGEGFPKWHCERGMYQTNQRALAFMTYLNDVSDGGGTVSREKTTTKERTHCYLAN